LPTRADSDSDALLSIVAERFYKTATDAIRSCDPNHLILGTRYEMHHAYRAVVEQEARFVDVLSVNVYPDMGEMTSPDCPENKICMDDWLRQMSEIGNKPILITEVSFQGADSGLVPNPGPAKVVDDRGAAARWFIEGFAQKPYFVGYHWFQYTDQPAAGTGFHKLRQNCGLVNINDDVYVDMTNQIQEAHNEVYPLHLGE
jgi:hypothetical protein